MLPTLLQCSGKKVAEVAPPTMLHILSAALTKPLMKSPTVQLQHPLSKGLVDYFLMPWDKWQQKKRQAYLRFTILPIKVTKCLIHFLDPTASNVLGPLDG